MPSIGFLHLTDLHFGLGPQKWLWPNFRALFFEDIRRSFQRSGPWDLVIFSGDLVQSGLTEEFERLDQELNLLWALFSELGCRPALICVPGNHDLTRPNPNLAAVKVMRNWFAEPDVRHAFWNDPSSEYRQVVEAAFANYKLWFEKTKLPILRPKQQGILPGDGAVILETRGLKIGIVSLNSTFLQLTNGDYDGHLDLDVRQLYAATDGDPNEWCKQADFCILVTHQNVAWLEETARINFRSEIYPSGRFFAHYCGHLHNPDARELREAGAEARRQRLGVSLFGLEYWGTNQEARLHGYSTGRYDVSHTEGVERIWPRISRKNYAGDWRIVADTGYDLDDDNSTVTRFDLKSSRDRTSSETDPSAPQEDIVPVVASEAPLKETIKDEAISNWSLVTSSFDDHAANSKLQHVPRTRFRAEPQHMAVRKEDQSRLELALRQKRCGWVIADWGLGKDGFIGCVLARLGLDSPTADVFKISCEDVENVDSLIALFGGQLTLSFSEFFGSISALKSCCLVLDGIPEKLLYATFGDEQSKRFHEIISAILEYASKLIVVLTARRRPTSSPYEVVQLHALELFETRDYLNQHSRSTSEVLLLETQEILYERSEGLPVHLDRLLDKLTLTSLAEILQDELESNFVELSSAEPLPRALQQAVASLADSTDRYTKRSYKLLKVLTILSDGETLESIKRFYPAEPFHHQNITQLLSLSLLEVVPVRLPMAQMPSKSSTLVVAAEIPKILKIPRQVRDYVRSNTSDSERNEILMSASDLLLGRRWREGKVKLRQDYTLDLNAMYGAVLGNERTVLHHLLWKSLQNNDKSGVRRAARLAVDFSGRLNSGDRFRDLHQVSHDSLVMLENHTDQYPDLVAQLAKMDGTALRMLGRHDEAMNRLRQALKIDKSRFSNEDYAMVYIESAFALRSLGDNDAAVDAADNVLRFTNKGTGLYLQAVELIATIREDEVKLRHTMMALLQEAHSKNRTITINNLSISLASRTLDTTEAIRLYNTVLDSKGDEYNKVRAILGKGEALKNGLQIGELSNRDKRLLGNAYTYTHAQRLGTLFDQAHDIIWSVFASQPNSLPALLALYRHSSFQWRLRGETGRERIYLEALLRYNLTEVSDRSLERTRLDLQYLRLRQASFEST